jgi:hypothetical protein
VKNITHAKLDQVSFSKTLLVFCKFANFPSLVFLSLSVCSFQLIQEETRGKTIEAPESSSEAEDNEDADDGEEGGDIATFSCFNHLISRTLVLVGGSSPLAS